MMMTKFLKYIFITTGVIVIVIVIFTQTPAALAALVPECTGGVSGVGCGVCDFFHLVENIINFMLLVVFPLAAAFIVYGGFMIMVSTGSPERVKSGRDIIATAVVGLAIALAAWLVIDLILQIIVDPSVISAPWNEISC